MHSSRSERQPSFASVPPGAAIAPWQARALSLVASGALVLVASTAGFLMWR